MRLAEVRAKLRSRLDDLGTAESATAAADGGDRTQAGPRPVEAQEPAPSAPATVLRMPQAIRFEHEHGLGWERPHQVGLAIRTRPHGEGIVHHRDSP